MEEEMLKVAVIELLRLHTGKHCDLVLKFGDELVERFYKTGLIKLIIIDNQKYWIVSKLSEEYINSLNF